jgi:predicted RNase H-like nuclease
MGHSKKTRDGVDERLDVLERVRPGARKDIAVAYLKHGGFDAQRDDIIDAFVAALCALHIDRCRTLPETPERDRHDLPMEMVYLPRDG